jgi:hypothetical protein
MFIFPTVQVLHCCWPKLGSDAFRTFISQTHLVTLVPVEKSNLFVYVCTYLEMDVQIDIHTYGIHT